MSSALPRIIRNFKLLTQAQCGRLSIHRTTPALQLQQTRDSSYRSSQPVQSLDQYPEVEVVENPPEWKYVERLLPAPIVPKPTATKPCPSGWQPQILKGDHKHGYHIARTKNYMVPVYLETSFRGQRRLTIVRRIQGDIWALERDLRKVVEAARNGKVCASRVNELSGQIHFHGDYVDVVREHLKAEGF